MNTKILKKVILTTALSAAMAVTPLSGSVWATENRVQTSSAESDDSTTSVQASYKTVMEGFDWGPAITKLVIDTKQNLDSKAVIEKDTFKVNVVIKKAGLDEVVREGGRDVTNAYVSDESGKKAESGRFVTIEMAVGPKLDLGSPFYPEGYVSKFADCEYTITQEKSFIAADNQTIDKLALSATNYDAKNSVSLISDEFDTTGIFNYKDNKFGDIKMHYASYSPATDSKKNALIIWLHGMGEGGADARVPLTGNKVVNLASEQIQGYFDGAYVLAPQCPTLWMDGGSGWFSEDGTSMYTSALMECIKNYVDNNSDIDTDRIYIGGCSNGGYMTVKMITTYPDYFTAAFPICEAVKNDWLTDDMVNAIKDMPIWFTHAYNDDTVPISKQADDGTFIKDENGRFIPSGDYTIPAVERLKAAGGKNIHLSLFDDVHDTSGKYFAEDGTSPYQYGGHFSWIYTLNNECVEKIDGKDVTIMEWMAAQRRLASEPEATELTIKKDNLTVKKGKTVKIQASVKNADGQKITYKSKNKRIASVNAKGVVRGVKKGRTKILVMCNGVEKEVKVTVKK